MSSKLTIKQAKSDLKALGVTLSRTVAGDFRVVLTTRWMYRGEGYFTPDLSDAYMTGKRMAAERDAKQQPPPTTPV
jgi:hypothetical protein